MGSKQPAEVEALRIETNVIIGRTVTIDQLFDGRNFEAVFIGSGAGLPMFIREFRGKTPAVYSPRTNSSQSNIWRFIDNPIHATKVAVAVALVQQEQHYVWVLKYIL